MVSGKAKRACRGSSVSGGVGPGVADTERCWKRLLMLCSQECSLDSGRQGTRAYRYERPELRADFQSEGCAAIL
jgi:hypothetical protein